MIVHGIKAWVHLQGFALYIPDSTYKHPSCHNRYRSPIGVCELMSLFAATHSSMNALLQETDMAYVRNTPLSGLARRTAG